MAHRVDPLQGLNPDQSGPKEKIQNGDPNSSPHRDQRSGAIEAGGTSTTLQHGPTGTPEGQVVPHDLVKTDRPATAPLPAGVSDAGQLPAGTFDRAGTSPTLGDIKSTVDGGGAAADLAAAEDEGTETDETAATDADKGKKAGKTAVQKPDESDEKAEDKTATKSADDLKIKA